MGKEQNKTKKKGIISLFFTAEVFGMALTLLCVLVLLRLIAGDLLFGTVGEKIGQFFLGVFGYFSFPFLLLCAFWGIKLLIGFKVENFSLKRFVKYFLIYAFFIGLIFQSALTPVTLPFNQYLGYCYDTGISYQTCSAGGVFLGLFANLVANFLTPIGAYVLYSLFLIITTLILMRKQLSSMMQNLEKGEKKQRVRKEKTPKKEIDSTEDNSSDIFENLTTEIETEPIKPARSVIFGGGAFEKKSEADKKSSSSGVKVLFGNQTFGSKAGVNLAYTTPVSNEKSYREKYDEDIERKTDFVRQPYETGATKVYSPMGEKERAVDIPLFNSGRERDMDIDVSGPEKDVYVFNSGGKTRETISPFDRRVNDKSEREKENSTNGFERKSFNSTTEDYNRDRFSSFARTGERNTGDYSDFSRDYSRDTFSSRNNDDQRGSNFNDSQSDRGRDRISEGNFGNRYNDNNNGTFERNTNDNFTSGSKERDGFSRLNDKVNERDYGRTGENLFNVSDFTNSDNERKNAFSTQDDSFVTPKREVNEEDFNGTRVNPLTRAMQESEDLTPSRTTMDGGKREVDSSNRRSFFNENESFSTEENGASSYDDENAYNGSFFDAENRTGGRTTTHNRDRANIVINGKIPGQKTHTERVNTAKENTSFTNSSSTGTNTPVRGRQMTMDDLPEENQLINPIDNIPKNYKYAFPPITLLKDYVIDEKTKIKNEEEQKKRADTIITLLRNANIEATMEGIKCGPAITRFELSIPPTVSVKRINEKYEDLNYWIASQGKIRLLIPIQGTSRIGIEVPNSSPATVGLKTIVESREFKTAKQSSLSFCLGADIIGRPVVLDIAKMPHLLVAGATGTGKSVFLNTLLISLIYKYSPEELRIILVDPKVVEFSVFKGMPNLMFDEIFTDNAKVCSMLEWAVQEMEDRYQKLNAVLAKNIEEYNGFMEKKKGKKMPKILIIIDEFADLMASSGERKLMENKISRLAAKARAAGIHLIMATQRPSADIMEGSIKTNFTSRIAFKMSSGTDAQVIMGEIGAEKLLGRGDVLFRTSNMPASERAQGCFIDTPEIVDICNYVKEHNESYYDEFALEKILKGAQTEEEASAISESSASGGSTADGNAKSDEELIKTAMRIAIKANNVSISGLQRRIGLGYPKAAKLVDTLTAKGYISEPIDPKTRKIFMTKEQFEETFGEPFGD